MNVSQLDSILLHTLFSFARHGKKPTLVRLAAATELSHSTLVRSLAALRDAGLVQDRAPRLTLPGLALAVAIGRPRTRSAALRLVA